MQKDETMRLSIPPERPREIAPKGMHMATCCAVCDLGTQPGLGAYGPKRQIYVAWEIPGEKTNRDKPHVVGKFYNLTFDSRGALRPDLEGWYGRVLDGHDIAEINLLEDLPGRPALIGVVHDTDKTGRRRANVSSVMYPGKDAPGKLTTVNDPIVFGLDEGLDRNAYNALPEWLRNIIARSLESREATTPKAPGTSTEAQLKEHLKRPGKDDDLDDQLPF
jgi:hypothetical protein